MKLKIYKGLEERNSKLSFGQRAGAVFLGFTLAFSPILGPVAMAESKTAVAQIKAAGYDVSKEEISAMEFVANLDSYYNKSQAGEKLPKDIVDLLKKHDGEEIYKILTDLSGRIFAEEGVKLVEYKRPEYNYEFPGILFLENEKQIEFANELQAMHNEVVKSNDKQLSLDLYKKVVDYFEGGQKKGEYGFRGIVSVIFGVDAAYATNMGWARKDDYLEAMHEANAACYFGRRQIATVELIRSNLGIIKDYELPTKIYPATKEQLDAEAALLETNTPEPTATPTELAETPSPEVVETPVEITETPVPEVIETPEQVEETTKGKTI